MERLSTDYRRPGVTWVNEVKSRESARRFAAACGRLGVVAFPIRNDDGTWRVGMTA